MDVVARDLFDGLAAVKPFVSSREALRFHRVRFVADRGGLRLEVASRTGAARYQVGGGAGRWSVEVSPDDAGRVAQVVKALKGDADTLAALSVSGGRLVVSCGGREATVPVLDGPGLPEVGAVFATTVRATESVGVDRAWMQRVYQSSKALGVDRVQWSLTGSEGVLLAAVGDRFTSACMPLAAR